MHLGRDENWLIRIAPAAELAKEEHWKALTNDMVLAALESAMVGQPTWTASTSPHSHP